MPPDAPANPPVVRWDYTEHAATYDRRPDYAPALVDDLLARARCAPGADVADVGAGTGKLTKALLARGLVVHAVEPNDAMRARGLSNAPGARWSVGTGESTGLASGSVAAVFFGSSFNVVDAGPALAEAARILVPGGALACLWNHRDLDDPVQADIEAVIRSHIPDYTYGSRREDPSGIIAASNRFGPAEPLARRFVVEMTRTQIVEAWRSHATLRRQAGTDAAFWAILDAIDGSLRQHGERFDVPYFTRAWLAFRRR